MKSACHCLHERVAKLPRLSGRTVPGRLPSNGLYMVFEKGESSHGQDRIVRVGTHTGDGNLQKRISEHLYVANKDRSVFRKHIGRCILASRDDPFLPLWEQDMTPKRAREEFQHLINFERQAAIEDEVTAYIENNLSICILEVEGKAERLQAEKSILSTLAQCDECRASPDWLGRNHPRPGFGEAGVWNIQGLNGEPLSVAGVEAVFEM